VGGRLDSERMLVREGQRWTSTRADGAVLDSLVTIPTTAASKPSKRKLQTSRVT
jgi:hypothetical protein